MVSPACRELDGVLGMTEALTNLRDTRGGRNVQYQVVPLLRQSVYCRLAGYEHTNEAERLALPNAIKDGSLCSRQVRLVKMGGRLVRHARRLVFQLAEVAVL